jgi:dephospho-CoA kinase
MIRTGLTGNIGSGKSAVASVFSYLGVPVYHADEESKKFLKDPGIITTIARQFGQEVLEKGKISRSRLSARVFADPAELRKLNSILHPLVMTDYGSWMLLNRNAPYLIMESAIIFENGFAKEFDRIIHVSCPGSIAIERVMKRDGVSREMVVDRMKHQLKDDDKARLSDFVIINDGSQMLVPQVLAIHRKLLTI